MKATQETDKQPVTIISPPRVKNDLKQRYDITLLVIGWQYTYTHERLAVTEIYKLLYAVVRSGSGSGSWPRL